MSDYFYALEFLIGGLTFEVGGYVPESLIEALATEENQ